MTNANDPAYPTHPGQPNGLTGEEWSINLGHPGFTKRELIAVMAMQGISSDPSATDAMSHEAMAKFAVGQADALIAELSRGAA